MATFRKRGNRWRAEVCVNGVRKSKTFDLKSQARRWADDEEHSTTSNRTLHQAFDRYLEEVSPVHKGYRWESVRIGRMYGEFQNKPLSELTKDDISKWKTKRLKSVTSGTVRREMTVLGQILNTCINEWGWLNRNPMKGVKRPPDNKARTRLIPQNEIDLIVAVLGGVDNIKTKKQLAAVCFLISIETAMRASEILSIKPGNFDRKKRVVRLIDTKNGDERDVPLTLKAVELLDSVQLPIDINSGVLSTYFRSARDQAGIKDLHFHDARAEALTRLSKKLDVLELARMVGHRDPRSLMIYYRESAEDIAKKI